MKELIKITAIPLFLGLGITATAHAESATVGGITITECTPFANKDATNFCSPAAISLYQKVIAKPVNNFAKNMTLLYFRSEIKDTKSLAHTYAVLDTSTKTVYPFNFAIFKLKPNDVVDNSKTQPKVYISSSQALCMKDPMDLINDGEIGKSYQSGIRTKEDEKKFTSICFGFNKQTGFSFEPFYPFLPQNGPAGFKIPVGF